MKAIRALGTAGRGSAHVVARVAHAVMHPVMHFIRGVLEVSPIATDDDQVAHHTIVINHAGMPVPLVQPGRSLREWAVSSVRERGRQLSDDAYRRYLRAMMRHIEARRDETPNGVAVIVHGGLQPIKQSFRDTVAAYQQILDDRYYPVFINWDSWLSNAYVEQLMLVRSGRYSQLAVLTFWMYLIADALMVVARLIPALFAQVRLAWRRTPFYTYPSTENLERFRATQPNLQVSLGRFEQRKGPWFWVLLVPRLVLWLIQIGFRIVAAGVITALAPRTWENLLRRARAVFRAPCEFDRNVDHDGYRMPDGTRFTEPAGAVAAFLRELDAAATASGRPIPITIIAHSMGAMIANEMVRHVRGHLRHLELQDLVYMAPACSVRDFADVVGPALGANPRMRAYVLTLHPETEAGETTWLGFVPRGSVLEWIEGFLDPPHSHLDRMLGKWDNVLRAAHVFEATVRSRISLKAFPYDRANRQKPYKHIQFNDPDVGFWRPAFWR